MKIDDIAKQLANKVNQEHYIKHYLEKVQRGAYNKGLKDSEAKQLNLSGVVHCVYVVTERDNYGEQLFKGVFANREKAMKFLAEDGLEESNIDEINEIELD